MEVADEQNRNRLDVFVCAAPQGHRDETRLWHERLNPVTLWVGLSPGASSLLTSFHREA